MRLFFGQRDKVMRRDLFKLIFILVQVVLKFKTYHCRIGIRGRILVSSVKVYVVRYIYILQCWLDRSEEIGDLLDFALFIGFGGKYTQRKRECCWCVVNVVILSFSWPVGFHWGCFFLEKFEFRVVWCRVIMSLGNFRLFDVNL